MVLPALLCLSGVVGLGASVTYVRFSRIGTRLNSWLVGTLRCTYDRALLDEFRGGYEWAELSGFRAQTLHAHPRAADLRCQATCSIQQFTRRLDRRRYDVSTSTRETNKPEWGVAGSREVFDMSDLNQAFRDDPILKDDVITMVDVDYYLDDFSRFAPHPIVLYTMMPNAVSGKTSDGYYYMDGNGGVVECVKGGAIYKSSIWDFTSDLCVVKSWFSFTVYAVEKVLQPGTSNRYVVYLCPRCTIPVSYWAFRAYAWIMGIRTDNAPPLKRINNVVAKGGVIVGRFGDYVEHNVSIRLQHTTHDYCTSIPERLWDTLVITKAKTDKKAWCIAQVQRVCEAFKSSLHNKSKLKFSNVDYNYIAQALDVGVTPRYQVNFQAIGGVGMLDLEEPKPIAEVAVEPIVTQTAVAACDTKNNEILCIEERVTKLRNDVVPDQQYTKFAKEFTDLLLRDRKGSGTPVGIEHVLDRQNSPVQRARQKNEAPHVREPNNIKAFVKNELGSKWAPNHNISTMAQSHTLGLSRYAYAFKEQVMKTEPYFAPGKNPTETVALVRKYAHKVQNMGKGQLIETDFSRFDATMSPFLRKVEHDIYREWVADPFKEELDALLADEVNVSAKGRYGTRYKQGSGRASGSPLTTEGNTLVNSFSSYCSYRKAGFDKEKAYDMIGPKYGDDGIDYSRGLFAKVAEDLGMTIKILAPGPRVSFVGRIYAHVYTSDSTMSPIIKLLQRVCMTNRIKDKNALFNRVTGYMVTDSHVPIAGNYMRALMRCYNLKQVGAAGVMEHDVARRHEMGPWPQGPDDHALLLECVSDFVGLLPGEVMRVCDMLDAAQTPSELEGVKLYIPALKDPEFKMYVV